MTATGPANSSEEEKDWNYSYHAVAFIDILGQKDAFRNINGVPSDPEGHTHLFEVLKKTVTFVEFFRQGFRDYFNSYTKPTGGENKVPKEFREEFLGLKKSNITLYGLSDAVVVWTPLLANDNHCTAINSIFGILTASAGMFIISLAGHHAIRGGIEIDGGVRLAPDSIEIYGPALNKAYTLECSVAGHPRIVIGPGMINFLQTVSRGTSSERRAIYARQIAAKCLRMIVMDSDGCMVLDYLGKEILEIISNVLAKGEVLVLAKRFVESEVAHWEEEKDLKLNDRYQKVLDYFNAKLPNL